MDRKNTKTILLVIMVLILGSIGFGIYSYEKYSKSSNIKTLEVESGKIYPSYNKDVSNYSIYTDKDEITINCNTKNKNIKGCNEKIKTNINGTTHEIVTKEKGKEKKYTIKIVKQENEYSKVIRIKNIEGIPTKWVKKATLKVNIENVEKIEGVMYSFDGGKSWQEPNTIEITNNQTIQVLAKDYFGYITKSKPVVINKIDNEKPKVAITKKTISKGKVLLSATATDNSKEISGYNWNSRGYSAKNILEVTTPGSYSVTVKDKVGNESEKATIQITETNLKDPNEKEFVAIFNENGADKLTTNELRCTTNKTSCTVKAPSITRNGYVVLGWSENNTDKKANVKVGDTITLTKDKKLYAITYKNQKVIFNKGQADSIGANQLSCNIYNNETSCKVIAPKIIRKGYNGAGWSKNKEAKGIEVNQNEKITVSKANEAYYAITYNKVAVKLVKNGANTIGSNSLVCYMYENDRSCNITLPSITPAKGFGIIGWAQNPNATTKSVSVGDKITVNKGITYYAVTKSNSPYTIMFNKNGANTISSNSSSCYRYNGSSSCIVKMPSITPTSGFSVIGWGNSASSTTKVANTNQDININKNTTYYAITRSSGSYKATFNKNGSKSIGSTSQPCYRYNGSSSCIVKMPSITPTSGFSVIGWGNSASSTTKVANTNQDININKNTTYYAITRSSGSYKATFNKNGAKSIGSTKLPCYRYNGNSNCTVKMPSITPVSGFSVLGWSTTSTATNAAASVNQDVNINKNITYYAITRSSGSYTVTFNKNGAKSIRSTSLPCYRYNGSTKCSVTMPGITPVPDFKEIGWSTTANATSATANVNQVINVNKNTTYYAITKSKEPYKVTFWPRTASINNYSIGTGITPSCDRYNGASSCTITTPSVKTNSKQQFLGWTTSQTATSSSIKANQKLTLTQNATYYAIVKETLTATFNKNGANSLSFYTTQCTSYGDGCILTNAPVIYKKGYETWGGFSFDKVNGTSSGVINKKITKDTNLYAKQDTWSGHPQYASIGTTYSINNVSIEVEQSNQLPYSVYNKYYQLLKDSVYKNMPYLFHYRGKLRMLSNYSYTNKFWSSSSAGITFGYGNEYSNVDINMGSSYDEYTLGTFVHELGHALDCNFRAKTGKLIRDQADIMALYNKYKNASDQNRPLRKYSYGNSAEFVADLFRYYYYYKYRTNVSNPAGGNPITKDKQFVTVTEKYIRMAKNDYK